MKARILLADDHEVLRESQAARNLVLAMDALLGGGTFFGAPPKKVREDDKPNPGLVFFRGLGFAF